MYKLKTNKYDMLSIFETHIDDVIIGLTTGVITGLLTGALTGYGIYYFTSHRPMKKLKDRKSYLLRDYLMKFTRSFVSAYIPAHCALIVFSDKYDDKAFTKSDLSVQLRKRYKLLEITIDVLRDSYSEFIICYATIEEFLPPEMINKIKNLSLDYLYDDIISRWTDLVMYKETHSKIAFSKEAMEIEYNLHDSIAAFMESLSILEKMYPGPYNTAPYWRRITRIDVK